MARKRSPEHDWICRRCLAACDAAGTRHMAQGALRPARRGDRRMTTTCGRAPDPVLRTDWDAQMEADATSIRGEIERRHREGS